MPKKEPVVKGTSVMELRLGCCTVCPTKRLVADLHAVAEQCNRVRNAVARHWLRWHEDNPDYQPQQRRKRDGSLKVNPAGQPVVELKFLPQVLDNLLYHKGREVGRPVAAKLISHLRGEVTDLLKSKVPYNRKREGVRFRWESILGCYEQLPTFVSAMIPVPTQDAILVYDGRINNKVGEAIGRAVLAMGGSECVLRFPIFSREAGREQTDVVVRLEVRQKSHGDREVVRRVASGEWKLADSKLVFKRNAWFFQMTYTQPREDLHLNPDNTAELFCAAALARRPFTATHGDEKPWEIGDALPLERNYERLVVRRKVMRNRYRTAGGAGRGHGRGRFFSKFRPYERATSDMQARFVWNAIRDVMKFCLRNNCGTLIYREPSLGLRAKEWFAHRGIPFDWTRFRSNLKHKCWIHGIELSTERMSFKDYRERHNVGENSRSQA